MDKIESRRRFLKTGLATTAGVVGLAKVGCSQAPAVERPIVNTEKKKKIIIEKTKKIYSSPPEVPFKYCAWTDMAFWHGKYYIIFSRKTHHAYEPSGPGLVLIESTDLENWTEQVLPDFPNRTDQDPKLLATPDRLFAFQCNSPGKTYRAYTEDGTSWSSWQRIKPNGPDGPNFECWRVKQYNGTYYGGFDNGFNKGETYKVNLCKSTDPELLDWQYVGTILQAGEYPLHKPSEPEILFLEDGRCIVFIKLNAVQSPTTSNQLPYFAISSPPYTSWDINKVGTAIRFGGPAAERFGDTILVVARGEVGSWPGYWDIPGEPPSTPGINGRRMRTMVYTFDLETMSLEYHAILPSELYFDSSYAGILPTGKDSAVVSWYDGDFHSVSNIWLAHLKIA